MTKNKGLNQNFDGFQLLENDEESDLLFVTNFSGVELNPVAKLQSFLHPKVLFTGIFRAQWLEFSSHCGRHRSNSDFKFRFY